MAAICLELNVLRKTKFHGLCLKCCYDNKAPTHWEQTLLLQYTITKNSILREVISQQRFNVNVSEIILFNQLT